MNQFTYDDALSTFTHIDLSRQNHDVDADYPASCHYSPDFDGNAGCIAGHVVQQLDPSLYALLSEKYDTCSFAGLPSHIQRNFTRDALELLDGLQYYADAGKTWREALEGVGVRVDTQMVNTLTQEG